MFEYLAATHPEAILELLDQLSAAQHENEELKRFVYRLEDKIEVLEASLTMLTAQTFGGGGHARASGFVTDYLVHRPS